MVCAGMVVNWPRRTIQRAMAVSLVITAILIVLRQTQLFPSGGNSLGLSGAALHVGSASQRLDRVAHELGDRQLRTDHGGDLHAGDESEGGLSHHGSLGLPDSARGGNSILPLGRFDRRTALGLALGGVPGVLIAVFLVKEMHVDLLRWIVVAVLLYTSATLYRSSRAAAAG